jgi:hypothetical protein
MHITHQRLAGFTCRIRPARLARLTCFIRAQSAIAATRGIVKALATTVARAHAVAATGSKRKSDKYIHQGGQNRIHIHIQSFSDVSLIIRFGNTIELQAKIRARTAKKAVLAPESLHSQQSSNSSSSQAQGSKALDSKQALDIPVLDSIQEEDNILEEGNKLVLGSKQALDMVHSMDCDRNSSL